MNFTDKVSVSKTKKRADGYLVADAKVARTGIQLYAGWEVGRPDMAVVRVYRPAEEVFSRDTMASFAHRPLTKDHPSEMVTAENWKQYSVGHTGDEIARDGSYLRIPMMVADAASIKSIEDGQRELSAGYTCDLEFEEGTSPDGEAYDAIQKKIRANHVAIVKRGRAGSECRIGDRQEWGLSPITQPEDEGIHDMADALRKILVDGLQVETTEQGAQAIEKLTKDLSSSAAKLSELTTAKDAEIAKKDTEIAQKDAQIAELKAKVMDAKALDAMVAKRAKLVADAKLVAKDVKTEGLNDEEIRKAAVAAALGDDAVKDRSQAYIDARFEILVEDAGKQTRDPVRDAFIKSPPSNPNNSDNGQTAYEKRLSDAWKQTAKEA